MFVYSVTAQKIRIMSSLLASVAVILAVVMILPMNTVRNAKKQTALEVDATPSSSDFKNIETPEDRILFLNRCGWEVEEAPTDIEEVLIPGEFDGVYNEYNALQTPLGLNLENYKGKSVKRFTYRITNYEYDGSVFAHLLIYKNRVIGGDVASAKADGFIHSLIPTTNSLA